MNASRKVLVVDDDPAVRKSIDRVLSNKGYAVITAENGEEAMRKLNEEKYDLVYTDIRMPGMSGLDVAEQVKARKPWTPVVIITGYGTDAAQARAKAAGVSSFVHKPLSPEMIEDSARDALAAPAPQVLALPAAVEAPQSEAPAAVARYGTSFCSSPRPSSAWPTSSSSRSSASAIWRCWQGASRPRTRPSRRPRWS